MNETILVIDDDPRNTFALAAVLRSRGYNCISCAGMQEAFPVLEENRIEVILMDMMMPGMDGYEAIPLLKQSERYKSIPIIAVTAQAMAGDKQRCLDAGADDYISKPVNIDLLVKLLKKYRHDQ